MADIRGQRPRRPRRRLLLAQAPHVHVPRRRPARRPEPVRVHPGQHPRAVLVGPHRRPRRRHRQGHGAREGRHRPDAQHRPARADRRRHDARTRSSSAAASPACAPRSASPTSGSQVTLVEREAALGGWVPRLRADVPARPQGPASSSPTSWPRSAAATRDHRAHRRRARRQGRQLRQLPGHASGSVARAPGRSRSPWARSSSPPGFDEYAPGDGELGFGHPRAWSRCPTFKALVDGADGSPGLARPAGPQRRLRLLRRQPADTAGCANAYCSRFCCAATVQTAVQVAGLDPAIRQFHLYRDMRTYGKFEPLYTEARDTGSVFLKFDNDEPPDGGRRRPTAGSRSRSATC